MLEREFRAADCDLVIAETNLADDETDIGFPESGVVGLKLFAEHVPEAIDDFGRNAALAFRNLPFEALDPRDDIVTTIASGVVNGCPMARREMVSYYVIVSTAGHDTTAASIAGGLKALIDFPDQMAKLRADAGLLPKAAEEFVRWVAPVKHFMRTPREDVVLHGQKIAAGEALMLCYASACRDESVFPDGDMLRVDRPANPPHLAFGYGPHFCLGKPLALMEIRAFFAELLPRLRHVEPAGDPAYIESVFVSGLKQLPLRYRFG